MKLLELQKKTESIFFNMKRTKAAHEPVFVWNRNTFLESFTFLILILYLAQPTDSMLHRCEAKWKTWKGAQKKISEIMSLSLDFNFQNYFRFFFHFIIFWLFFLPSPSLTPFFWQSEHIYKQIRKMLVLSYYMDKNTEFMLKGNIENVMNFCIHSCSLK